MKKIFVVVLITILIAMNVAYSEGIERWAFNPRVKIYMVDEFKEKGEYTVYYCIDDRFTISYERDAPNNFGWIKMTYEDEKGISLFYNAFWEGEEKSQKRIDQLVKYALDCER